MVSHSPPIKIIFGGGGLGGDGLEKAQANLNILEKYGVKEIDTAWGYTGSEKVLGQLRAGEKFIIDTKAPVFIPHYLGKESILKGVEKQFGELGIDSVDTYFLHTPDDTTPIEETLEAVNMVYKAGRFRRFGLSNFKAEDVQKIHDICIENSYPPPSVYQGNYNPVARLSETELFPVLRKLNIVFSAYSPLAGGFWLRMSHFLMVMEKAAGTKTTTWALKEWASIAHDGGVKKSALAYRWVIYHSALKADIRNACIIGASSPTQLEETLKDIGAGPLNADTVERIEKIWLSVKDEAPSDNWKNFMRENKRG